MKLRAAAAFAACLALAACGSSQSIDKATQWNADLATGELMFTFDDGMTATAPLQVVGTFNTKDNTFLWGWDHPSVDETLAEHARLARNWGREHNVAKFKNRMVHCTQQEAWASLYSDTSRPFEKPKNGRIAVKVINHLGDEVMKVFRVQ